MLSTILRRLHLIGHVLRWRHRWDSYDADYLPPGLGPVFTSARQAVALIPDGATVISTGMAAHHRPSTLYWALRDRHAESGHPMGLTWCAVGAVGSRGRLPGSLEECAAPGLVTTLIAGHLETVRALLQAADRGEIEVHTMPQGEMAFLIEGQARGLRDRLSDVGVSTFLDPRKGPGSAVTADPTLKLISVADEHTLRYRLPILGVALISAPYADADGNIFVHDAACLTEIRDAARAVHANGGKVIVVVADVVEPNPDAIYLPAEIVDAIVVNPRHEQTGSVPQRQAWPMFTLSGQVDEKQALADLRFANELMKITPRRTTADQALARLAAAVISRHLAPGAVVNIGIGLPEEASRILHEAGLTAGLTQTSEAGVWGGVPACGMFFGASINPERQESSSWMFHQYAERLDLACLGLLQVDSDGNVNVSRRGERPSQYVGPGGFTNIVHCARTIVFVGAFEVRPKLRLAGGRLVIDRQNRGEPKFVDHVREITFSGPQALSRGQNIWYATHVGLFHLTGRGLELVMAMPGVDIESDVLAHASARIVLPPGGIAAVATVPPEIVTGAGFHLAWDHDALDLPQEK